MIMSSFDDINIIGLIAPPPGSNKGQAPARVTDVRYIVGLAHAPRLGITSQKGTFDEPLNSGGDSGRFG
jgi:hypothetical protein